MQPGCSVGAEQYILGEKTPDKCDVFDDKCAVIEKQEKRFPDFKTASLATGCGF